MERARWSSRRIFLFAAIGSAVGLGNVWRFPYLTYKFGGGAFLIPYLTALFFLGIPLLILEFALGQKLQKGAVGAFTTIDFRFRGIGFCAIFSGFIVVIYYAAVMAWSLIFLLNSFTTTLPWSKDAKGFFFNDVLEISEGIGMMGGINWMLFSALLAVWVMIYFSVWKGVKSVGQIVKITMPLPIFLLFVLFLRGITLEGAMTGIYHYLTPNFSALLNAEIWLAATSQIFFTLSLGFGIMIAYASYNEEGQDITGDALITSLANSAISLFAGFVVFSILGYMATTTSVGVEDVVASGPGLAFVVFPQALSLMPGAWFFAVLFFVTLLSLGIDSAFSLVEAVNTVFADRAKKPMLKQISFFVCSICFLLGILFTTRAGLYWLDVIDHFITSFGLVLVGIFECLVIGWVYGADRLREYINDVSHRKLGLWWSHAIKWFIPGVLGILVAVQFVTELKGNYEGYPGWAIGIGWATVILPVMFAIGLIIKPLKSKETGV